MTDSGDNGVPAAEGRTSAPMNGPGRRHRATGRPGLAARPGSLARRAGSAGGDLAEMRALLEAEAPEGAAPDLWSAKARIDAVEQQVHGSGPDPARAR